ncbi:uncharacterized protein VTP21DRAFT_7093 [Calcarisporiella thermophila]|uniref:uncharacterized protein n=1 Tax=Calcarisporiella thermophila TaxID=911321 RepID=UPI00374280E4
MIDVIRSRLNEYSKKEGKRYKWKWDTTKKLSDAAVLMPLCVVDGQLSVLFTVRSLNLREHQGEISFPGGKRDSQDESLHATSLRETQEEIGISSSSIDILGQLAVLPNKTRTLRVYPFVGFIREPLDLKAIQYNCNEVERVFTLPLSYLYDPKNRRTQQFRDSKYLYPVFKVPESVGLPPEIELWGLTAFITDTFLRILGQSPTETLGTHQ